MKEQNYIAPTALNAETDQTDGLNDLLTVLHDSREGFRTAADAIEDGDYAALFEEYAQQREQMAAELSNLIVRYHGEPVENGSVAGSLHRAWINIKAAATQGDDSILAECDLGEESALKTYQDVLTTKEMSDDVREVIRQQMSLIRLAHERIHALNVALN